MELVIAGLMRQTYQEFSIILSDDGSSENEVESAKRILDNSKLAYTYLWQEDNGFRKNEALNKSISVSSADYIIFIDADCIPHPSFVEEHVTNSSQKTILTGRRVNLPEMFSKALTPSLISVGFLEKSIPLLLFKGLSGEGKDAEKGFYFRNKMLRSAFNKKQRGILGCNFSLYRKGLLECNGFDERYQAPSVGEDTDIEFRLRGLGYTVQSLNNIAVQYHLYHKQQTFPQKNLDLFETVKQSKQYVTQFGIVKEKKDENLA